MTTQGTKSTAGNSPSGLHVSRGLEALGRQIKASEGFRVLDLGPARPANVEYFRRFSHKLWIEDLHSTLVADPLGLERGDPLAGCLELGEVVKFDLIILWDILNYLSPSRAMELGERLAHLSHSKTIVFAMVWTDHEMPATPNRYTILADGQLLYEPTCNTTRGAPRHTKKEIKELLPGFDRTRSFLIKSGVEEYLLSACGPRINKRTRKDDSHDALMEWHFKRPNLLT